MSTKEKGKTVTVTPTKVDVKKSSTPPLKAIDDVALIATLNAPPKRGNGRTSEIAELLQEVSANGAKGQWYSGGDHNYGAILRVRKNTNLKESVKVKAVGEGKEKKIYLQRIVAA